MAARAIVVATADSLRLAGAVRDGLTRAGLTTESVSVAESSDLSAAILRAGRVKPEYAVAVVVGSVEPGLESFVSTVRPRRRRRTAFRHWR